MAYYAKLLVQLEASDYSDYANPDAARHETTLTPDEWSLGRRVETTGTSATTVATSLFTSLSCVVIKNEDSTNYVTVTWTSADTATNTMRLPAGAVTVLYDVTAASNFTLTANTAAVVCRVSMTGT